VINALWERCPELQLTVCGSLPHAVVAARLDRDFSYRQAELDPVLRMHSAWEVDVPASVQVYADFHRDREAGLSQDLEMLRELRPDVVLADIPYRILIAAQAAGVPAIGLCSLNWAAIHAAYCADSREGTAVNGYMLSGYRAAEVFLAPAPALPMPELENCRAIGPIARTGRRRLEELRQRTGLPHGTRYVLVAMGGIATRLPLANWPRMAGVAWVFAEPVSSARNDIVLFDTLSMPFIDVLASVAAVFTKPGYGTYAEAVCNGVPLLALERRDWPETRYLNDWARAHGRFAEISRAQLEAGDFAAVLERLWRQPVRPPPEPAGIAQAADIVQARL
jgi:hypothetical protein